MKNSSVEKTCEFCDQPLQREISVDGIEFFICINTKCPAQRLSRLEIRLESIVNLLKVKSMDKEKIISVPEKVEVQIKPKAEFRSRIKERIRILSNLSLKDGKIVYHSLIDQLEGSPFNLESLLEQTAKEEFSTPQF